MLTKCRLSVNCLIKELLGSVVYAKIKLNSYTYSVHGSGKMLMDLAIEMNENPLSDHTERYKDAGLSQDFIAEMAKVIAALKATGYEPYGQLCGYTLKGNDQYITRFGGAREIVTKMDVKDIKTFLKHYKDHK